MPSASLRIATAALDAIAEGLAAGGTLNLGALEAFNAGMYGLAETGAEPSPNQELAFSNLTEMLIDTTAVAALPAVSVDVPLEPDPVGPGADAPVLDAGAGAEGVAPVAIPAPATDDSDVQGPLPTDKTPAAKAT